MPRTPEPTLFDRTFAQRAALMWTCVVDTSELALIVAHRKGLTTNSDRRNPAFFEFTRLENSMPFDLVVLLFTHRARIYTASRLGDTIQNH